MRNSSDFVSSCKNKDKASEAWNAYQEASRQAKEQGTLKHHVKGNKIRMSAAVPVMGVSDGLLSTTAEALGISGELLSTMTEVLDRSSAKRG